MIYLVRHGRTAFNEEGRYQGGKDSPLTALGLSQAARVGRLLRGLIGDPAHWSIVASPLGRTVHTAQIIRAEIGQDAAFTLDPRLAEVRMGLWDGLTDADIEQVSPGLREGTSRSDFFFRAPGGETHDDLAARLGDWLAQTLAHGRPTIAISHGVSSRVLRGLYLKLPPAEALRLETPQDAVFRLEGGAVTRIDA
jgi:probable phosphoglycerate mutase